MLVIESLLCFFVYLFAEPFGNYRLDPKDGLLLIVEEVPVFGLVSLADIFPPVGVFVSVPALFVKFKFFTEDDGVGLFVGEELVGLVDGLTIYTLGPLEVAVVVLVVPGLVRLDVGVEGVTFLELSILSPGFLLVPVLGVVRVVDGFFLSMGVFGSFLIFIHMD